MSGCVSAIADAQADDLDVQRDRPFSDKELRGYSETFAKLFCVALRRHHDDARASVCPQYIDPRYLKEHDLTGEHFRM